jgi:hypothetical protein
MHGTGGSAIEQSLAVQRSRVSAQALCIVAVSVWLIAIVWGVSRLHRFESSPGLVGITPAEWPTRSVIKPVAGRMTLVMLVHPQCSCTKASLEELNLLLAQMQQRVSTWVLFIQPAGMQQGWERSDAWSRARSLPGVTVLLDEGGAEAARLGALTSGHTVLYDASGTLVFSGGITGARGHAGANMGRESVGRLLQGQSVAYHDHAVFGCPLHEQPTQATRL